MNKTAITIVLMLFGLTTVLNGCMGDNIAGYKFIRANIPYKGLFDGVNKPERLYFMDENNPYRSCSGVVSGLKFKKLFFTDGDITFNVISDECGQLVNKANVIHTQGGIHCEISPQDRGYFRKALKQIKNGSIVEVQGIWVEDRGHKSDYWRELHPLTQLVIKK
ncbi:MAG: hypothetical protein HY445_03430 [Candidatus Niyogibacteria bacterium]|nr:hypothetical protein [Candidatus Niyogibacteria bacterium]